VTPDDGAAQPGGVLLRSLGVAMQPYLEGTSRVAVASGAEVADAVVKLLQQQDAGEAPKTTAQDSTDGAAQ
jgi:hypothetical protein